MFDLNIVIKRTAVWLVETSRVRAPWMVLLCLVLVGGLGFLAATRLGMDTDLDHLISQKEPWRIHQAAFDRAFPQAGDRLVAVVESDSADASQDAAAALAAKLATHKNLFSSIVRPDADPFFRREGLLFLPPDELSAIAAQVIEAQPFIGSLAADPSLRGLFGTLNLALEGVSRGEAPFSRLEKPLGAVTDIIESPLPKERPLEIRETPEFLAIAHRVREGLRAGHSYEV